MTYAMTLDNSWELMTEDEMYDVNGGFLNFIQNAIDHAWSVFTGAVYTAVALVFKTNVAILYKMANLGYLINGFKGAVSAVFYDLKLVAITVLTAIAAATLFLYNNGYFS
jgi:hypothetical protein